MFELIITLLISFTISLFVIYPLVKSFLGKDPSSLDIENKELELMRLEKKKEIIFGELSDIEFDYGLGKLNEKDYKELKDKYRYKAADVLKEIDDTK